MGNDTEIVRVGEADIMPKTREEIKEGMCKYLHTTKMLKVLAKEATEEEKGEDKDSVCFIIKQLGQKNVVAIPLQPILDSVGTEHHPTTNVFVQVFHPVGHLEMEKVILSGYWVCCSCQTILDLDRCFRFHDKLSAGFPVVSFPKRKRIKMYFTYKNYCWTWEDNIWMKLKYEPMGEPIVLTIRWGPTGSAVRKRAGGPAPSHQLYDACQNCLQEDLEEESNDSDASVLSERGANELLTAAECGQIQEWASNGHELWLVKHIIQLGKVAKTILEGRKKLLEYVGSKKQDVWAFLAVDADKHH